MQILIVAATEFEIAPFLKASTSVDFLITGVGSPMAVYHIAKRLQQIDYKLVIQAGIAGSFTSSLQPGEAVIVKQDCFADLGILENNNFSSLFDAGFADENEFPFTNGWLPCPETFTEIFSFEEVTGVTVNTVTDNEAQSELLRNKFDPQIETMEGAALHYTCLQEKVPFIQLRTISNYVGERDKSKWKMKEAIENLNIALQKITGYFVSGKHIFNV